VTRPDFFHQIFPRLIEGCLQCGIGPNGPGFSDWAYKTMYFWYKIAFFDETPEDKYEADTISVDYIFFSDF
jgi:hypothetical protein